MAMEIFKLFGSILVDDKQANESIAKVDKNAEGLGGKLGGITKVIGGVTLGLVAAGAAAATALGVKAFGSAKDLSQAMNNLQAQTGAADDEMSSLRDTALDIYNANLGENFDDIAASMAIVKQITGEMGDELKSSAKNALLLRDTFDFDVNESVRTANSLVKQFGITSEQAYTLMAQGAQNGANKNGDLLDSLNEYAPQFKALGFSADQFTNVLIDGAANGAFSIDKVGDAVKEFNIRAKDMSKTSVDAFLSLGLSANQMSHEFAAGGDSAQAAFATVIERLKEIKDPVEQNRIGVELFGTQFEDLQAQAILSLGEIGDKADSTAKTLEGINDLKYDNVDAALAGIGRNLETAILVPLGDKVLPKLNEFAGWIQAHMPEIQAGVEKAMDVAMDVFDDLSAVIGFVINNADILLPVILSLTAAIVAQNVIESIVSLYKAWKVATESQTTVQWLLNAALDANPIGAVVIAIGALVAATYLIIKNWESVKKYLLGFWDWIVEFFRGWGGVIIAVLMPFIGLPLLIIANWDRIKAGFGVLWDWVKSFFGKWGTTILAIIAPFIGVPILIAQHWDSIKTYFKNLWDSITGYFSNAWKKITDFVDKIKNAAKSLIGLGSTNTSASKTTTTLNAFASGTDYAPAGWALVGEEGPELVNFRNSGAQVKTADETRNLLAPQTLHATLVLADGRVLGSFVSQIQYGTTRQRTRSMGVNPTT